jgi:hypothetical protein
MPQSTEINTKFGVYRSVCCGSEIVINEGSTFPDCPAHPKLTTIWKPVVDEKISQLTAEKSEHNPAVEAHIVNRRLVDLAFGRLKLEESEQNHLHGCEVCQSVLNVFIHQPISAVSRKPDAA